MQDLSIDHLKIVFKFITPLELSLNTFDIFNRLKIKQFTIVHESVKIKKKLTFTSRSLVIQRDQIHQNLDFLSILDSLI